MRLTAGGAKRQAWGWARLPAGLEEKGELSEGGPWGAAGDRPRAGLGFGRGEGLDIWGEQGRELRGTGWTEGGRAWWGLDWRRMGLAEAGRSGPREYGLVGSRLPKRTRCAEGAGRPASALPLLHRSSSPSATFQKSWISASSRRRALARLRSIAWSPSPGQTIRSWWVLGPPPSLPSPSLTAGTRDGRPGTAAGPDTGPHRRPSSRGFPQRCPSWRSWMATSG